MNNFEDIYSQSIKASNRLIEDIRFSRKLDLKPIQTCAELIYQYLNNSINIVNLLNSVQDKNNYMYSHPVNVAFIACTIGKWMNFEMNDLYNLSLTGLLHDIGKAKIGDSILNKPDKLKEHEMDIIKSHTVLGYKILNNLEIYEPNILLGVLSHHERQDGAGYPNRLSGDQINLFAKIIAIADTYDAITSTKAYRTKSTSFKAVEEIQAESFGSLDPQICQIFINNVTNHYYGTHVRLSNEREGEVVYINPEEKTKPLVRCDSEYLNLSKERNVEIIDML